MYKPEAPSEATATEAAEVSVRLQGRGPQAALAWAFERFGDRIALASSFGGASGAALLDMAAKLNPGVRVFYLDTDYLFPETYANVAESTARYGIQPVAVKSRWTPEQQAEEFGPELWRRDPDMCCALRKVEPNGRALEGYLAWITGLRRDQSSSRDGIGIVEWDAKFDMVKVNPLAEWTGAQVWAYIQAHEVPYNPLLDRGYKSIGCVQCTRAVGSGEDDRAGRWDGFNKDECGLHSGTLTIPSPAAQS